LAASPDQRVEIALRGGRALGLAGHSSDALRLCHRGTEHAADVAPVAVARLEAELVCNAWLHAGSTPDARARLLSPAAPLATLELWRANAAFEAMLSGRPADDARALLRPALESAHWPASLTRC
jgi:hypothetical protein